MPDAAGAPELGVVLVGPESCRIPVAGVPVVRVRANAIAPADDAIAEVVGFAAEGTFHGADADRWRVLRPDQLRERTAVLWASAQVQAAGLADATAGWAKVLVVARAHEPALGAAVRALAGERPVTVLLGGPLGAGAQPALTVMAHLVRQGQLSGIVWNEEPADVLDVALDAARRPTGGAPGPTRLPRPQPVDIGPLLGQPATWCIPAPPVHLSALVHVPMGHAKVLPEIAATVAVWRALRDAASGPPRDVPVSAAMDRKVVDPALVGEIAQLAKDALDQVRLDGDELLVEQLDRHLRPVAIRVEKALQLVADVERQRLRPYRAFGAVGIEHVVQDLRARLERSDDRYPQHAVDELRLLAAGQAGAHHGDRVSVTAWRQAFAGVPSRVVRQSVPGWQVARQLVRDRLALLRVELAAALTQDLDVLVRRTQDPAAAPAAEELRGLHDRAERVRVVVLDAIQHFEQRIRADAEEALRTDRFVRWCANDATALLHVLAARVGALPVADEARAAVFDVLNRRPLGFGEERDFGRALAGLAKSIHELPESLARPSYEAVLLALLEGRDPPVLRQALAQAGAPGAEPIERSTDVALHVDRPIEPALVNWLTATGMRVVVAARLKTCAIYWQRLDAVDDAGGQRLRGPTTEHRLADLALPKPGGDGPEDLANLVRSVAYVLVGLVVGVFGVRPSAVPLEVTVLVGRDVTLPEPTVLPYGALHTLAADPALRDRVRRRIDDRIAGLGQRADALDVARKLVELASLGPAPSLAARLGLHAPRVEALEQPVGTLLHRFANAAVAALVDCEHSTALAPLLKGPRRRTLLALGDLVSEAT